jgi:hypothetical protein
MRSSHAEAVTLNLSQDLAIEVRRYANRSPPVLQVADPSNPKLILGVGASDLSPIEGTSIAVTKRCRTTHSSRVEPNPPK